VPFYRKTITDHNLYAALRKELFINGQTNTGTGTLEYVDHNWAFAGLVYRLGYG